MERNVRLASRSTGIRFAANRSDTQETCHCGRGRRSPGPCRWPPSQTVVHPLRPPYHLSVGVAVGTFPFATGVFFRLGRAYQLDVRRGVLGHLVFPHCHGTSDVRLVRPPLASQVIMAVGVLVLGKLWAKEKHPSHELDLFLLR